MKDKQFPGGVLAVGSTNEPQFRLQPFTYIAVDGLEQISRKKLKRLIRAFPKQKKARLPRKLKKRLIKRLENKNAAYVKMITRLKTGAYNLQRLPYSERKTFTDPALGKPYTPGPIEVKGVDSLYTIPNNSTNP